MSWSAEQVLALAPDPGSSKAGKDLATLRKWVTLGRDERSAWGECQGSGAKPYQTRIDLGEPAFSCTCPSRKFPCKHSLGLFLLLVQQPAGFKDGTPPAWVADWLASREAKAEKKAKKAEEPPAELDPEQARKLAERQARSALERKAKVDAGLADLDRWLGDLARRGLAAARGEGYDFWERPAARMVDAQAPGVARLLRELAGIPASGDGWQERLLERLARLHLLVEGYGRLDALPPEAAADLRAAVGWTVPQEEVLAGEGVRDRWVVLGQKVEEEDRIRAQRRWLLGESTGRFALALHFAHASQALDASLVPGTVIDADVAFFPGAVPLRALVKHRHGTASVMGEMQGHETATEATAAYASSLSRNPWLERFPIALRAVVPARRGDGWEVRDPEGAGLRLSPRSERPWVLAALSGGRPIGLFGEWDGETLTPMGAWTVGRFFPVA
jgi:SWIM zinc finger